MIKWDTKCLVQCLVPLVQILSDYQIRRGLADFPGSAWRCWLPYSYEGQPRPETPVPTPKPIQAQGSCIPERQWGRHPQPPRASCLEFYKVINKTLPLTSHSTWWVNCRQMWAEGVWGMKRDLYAHNEERENKCTSKASSRCWATLVNNQCPYGGEKAKPQRPPPWQIPPAPNSVFGFGWDLNFPARERIRNSGKHTQNVSPWFQHQSKAKNQVRGKWGFRRFLCLGMSVGMFALGFRSHHEFKGREPWMFKKEWCHHMFRLHGPHPAHVVACGTPRGCLLISSALPASRLLQESRQHTDNDNENFCFPF